jgi:hypothetical protein
MAQSPTARYTCELDRAIDTLRERMKRLNRVQFTHDEFLALFAPKEHWDILKTAADVADITAAGGLHVSEYTNGSPVGEMTISFVVSAAAAPLMPRNKSVLPHAPKELIDRLDAWVAVEIEIGYGFARAKALLSWLEANCTTKDQMRFLWPSLLALCSLRPYLADLGDRIQEFKPQRSLPEMPMEVRAACKSTSGIIASAMMLPAEEEPYNFPVEALLASVTNGVQEGALGFIRAA